LKLRSQVELPAKKAQTKAPTKLLHLQLREAFRYPAGFHLPLPTSFSFF